ncbi:aldo/keto reductase [Paenibacillus macerans]|uniref:aldo/keto reductase n=1 Tax=Paenibacillus macerans TaxID=44252 RepID=UPI00203ACDAA|nr:aldo/keto reductase [Paenibacillus macerans]MCM3698781.1 aldo/keto reductase [Paenibacillus macerans]
MKYMEIGKSGIQASVITFGAFGIGGGFQFPGTDDAESIRAIETALDFGVNIIDTAPVYGFGHSEEIIGKAIKGKRDKVVLSTKCGLWWGDDEGSYRFTWEGKRVKRNLSPRTIKIEVEQSLKRLGTDYIDIYYTHNPACEPFLTPIEDTIDTLIRLKKEGKIRAIGASNCEPHHIRSYIEQGEIAIVQRKYNMLSREVEAEILPLCKENGISFHAYSPLAQGLLSGNIHKDYVVPKDDPRNGDSWWQSEKFTHAVDFAGYLTQIGKEYGVSAGAIAIAYLRAKHEYVNVICGIRKERHLHENILGAQVSLSTDTMEELDRRLNRL